MTAHRLLPPCSSSSPHTVPSTVIPIPHSVSNTTYDPPRRRHSQDERPRAGSVLASRAGMLTALASSPGNVSPSGTEGDDGASAEESVGDVSALDSGSQGSDVVASDVEEDLDLPKLLVYDISVEVQGGECNFFSASPGGALPEATVFPRGDTGVRKSTSGWKSKGNSPKTTPEGRMKLFTIPLPQIAFTAQQGAAKEEEASRQPTPQESQPLLSPRSFLPGAPRMELGLSNVVYIRVTMRPLDVSPLVFVFLQQLVTEWQVGFDLPSVRPRVCVCV